MLPDSKALETVIDFLEERGIPYMVIGGIANSIWGRSRATHDVDFKISIDMPLAEFRKMVLEHFPARPTNLPAHQLSPHVIHIWALPKVAADLLVSVFDYERQAIDRAVEIPIEADLTRVCTAEDLIIHKAIAGRGTDWQDIEGVLFRQQGKLDLKYIREWLIEFAEALENPEMLQRFEKLYAEASS